MAKRAPKYFVVGLTHIDLAWKKEIQEHEEIMEAAVLRLVDVLDRYDGYTYIIEQAAHYRTLALRRPDLIERLRKHLQQGRLEFVGGLASTLETNGPSGESFVRNQLLGLSAIKELFGVAVRTGYLIDTFGVHAQVPQILRQFGMKGLFANRFGGALDRDVFVARGLDGTRMLVAGRDANSPYVVEERVFFKTARDYGKIRQLVEQAAGTAAVDGPCLVMPYTEYEGIAISYLKNLVDERNALEGEGSWAFATLGEFFDALPGIDSGWPEYSADLNPEFTGTFGQRVAIRSLHRKSESLLLEADKWASLLGMEDPAKRSAESWWRMAFVQSHDVYTGSHPTVVYESTVQELALVEQYSNEVLRRGASSLATPAGGSGAKALIALNGLPWSRDAIVEVALPELVQSARITGVRDGDTELPFDVEGSLLRFRASFPGVSAKSFALQLTEGGPVNASKQAAAPSTQATGAQKASSIGNEFVTVTADAKGGLRITRKGAKGEMSHGASVDITLQEDRGSFQIEDLKAAEVSSLAGAVHVDEPEVTKLRSRLILRGTFPSLWTKHPSPLKWEAIATIYPGKPQVDLIVRLDWHGEASRIRLKVSTDLESSTGIFEIPFGAVKRTPYHSRRTAKGEWPAHRWVAVEDGGAGVALVNTGSLGAEVAGGTIWSTLLRAPVVEYAGMIPDDTSSQHGQHEFVFSLLSYDGSWTEGGVIELGQEVNVPVDCYAIETGALEQGGSLLELAPSTVVLSAIKAPEDGEAGEIVVRVYEAAGSEVRAELRVKDARAAWQSDMLEAKGSPIDCLDGRIVLDLKPFEIRTIRVSRKPG